MAIQEWHEAIAQVTPYVFRINTPDAGGTGYLVSRSKTAPLSFVATAAHVVEHAHYWEEPIRLVHHTTDATVLVRPAERGIKIDDDVDTAAIAFDHKELKLPDSPLPLMRLDYHLKPGVAVGWLGFPALAKATLCFFSGHISAYLENESAYLVDGVAINGVSGGPAFICGPDSAHLIGIVSAYIPNRATGQVLPGVALIRDVNRLHALTEGVKNIDEAHAKQTPTTEPPSPPPTTEPPAATRG